MSVLFFHTMRYKVSEPRDSSSDRFILSKGHAAPILYAGTSHHHRKLVFYDHSGSRVCGFPMCYGSFPVLSLVLLLSLLTLPRSWRPPLPLSGCQASVVADSWWCLPDIASKRDLFIFFYQEHEKPFNSRSTYVLADHDYSESWIFFF